MGNISFTSSVPNAFIAILDTDGNWVTAKKIDNTKHSAISNMFIHLNGKIHFMGYEVGGTDSHISTFNMDGIFMGTATTDALSTSNKEFV